MTIETRYHGPTNTRGARVSARFIDSSNMPQHRVSLPWDDALDVSENHDLAARACLAKWAKANKLEPSPKNWARGSTPRGYVYVRALESLFVVM